MRVEARRLAAAVGNSRAASRESKRRPAIPAKCRRSPDAIARRDGSCVGSDSALAMLKPYHRGTSGHAPRGGGQSNQ